MQRRSAKNRHSNARKLAETEIREMSGRNPRKNALFSVVPEALGFQGLGGGVRSHMRTRRNSLLTGKNTGNFAI